MTDIFDTTITCKKCDEEMTKIVVNRQGFELRAVQCPQCGDKIIHPADVNGFQNYNNIKDKTFHVKLRMVGNSHAISIPKEIIEFMQQQERIMDDMVRLCFEDMRKLRIEFGEDDDTK